MAELNEEIFYKGKNTEYQMGKLSKIGKKAKMIEEGKLREYEDPTDLVKMRFTRTRQKRDKGEILTDPMLYNSRKFRKKTSEQENDSNSCNYSFDGVRDHSEDAQNDEEAKEKYEVIKKIYKTETGAKIGKTSSQKKSKGKEEKNNKKLGDECKQKSSEMIENLINQLIVMHDDKPDQEKSIIQSK